MFNSLQTPVLFAHRGASAHAPENTLPAFSHAISQGAPAIEIDIQLTSDGIPIVFHDTTLSRTTNGTGRIQDKSLEELKSFDAGVAFGSAFLDTKIPALEEIFTELDKSIFLNIELKNLASPFDLLPEVAANIITKHRAENRVLISSFNPIALLRIGKLLPEVPRGLLLHKTSHVDFCLLFPQFISGIQSLHISFRTLTRERVYAIHNAGKRVFTYTLNHPDDIKKALKYGVDGFFTDDPALGLRIIGVTDYNA